MKLGKLVFKGLIGGLVLAMVIVLTKEKPKTYTLVAPGACSDEFGVLSAGAEKEKTDKGPRYHNYVEIYEKFFLPLRDKDLRILEIGVSSGASHKLWESYFPKAMVYGLDIVDTSRFDSERIKTFIADQSKREDLKKFVDAHGKGGNFNLIIDDGGHTMDQQQISLGFLFKYLQPGGYYVIEDLQTSIPEWHPDDFGVNPSGNNSTLSMISHFISGQEFQSEFLSEDELRHINESVEYCFIWRRNRSLMSLCKKQE